MTPAAPAAREAMRLHVAGVVQGVGFRPFVHRLALRHALEGWVRNQAGDVEIAVEGAPEELEAFARALREEAPPLARVETVRAARVVVEALAGFRIVESTDDPARRQPVAPDVSMCAACEAELYDPADRRARYPFITCTDCGPRFTVIERLPYDRERTSMRAFAQCERCRAEYEDPASRRYHSETNACPDCGPRLHFELAGPRTDGVRELWGDPLSAAAAWIRAGAVIALRGMGGFHLACDATAEAAVQRLRARKRRDAKPLAVMVRRVSDARAIAEMDEAEARWLDARERPIVLLRMRTGAELAPGIAPGLERVGVMLAYTPLHALLLDIVRRPLVMTSANLSEEPIAAGVDEARERLTGIADAFLWHDREIVARIDDSVMRVAAGAPVWMRRARGYAPLPLTLPVASPRPLLAVGPHLKSTLTLAVGDAAYVSQHIGDLDNLETLEHWRATFGRYARLHRIEPEVAARDLHPGYLSTRVAEELAAELGLERVIPVQHHHAHVAAVMAEHGRTAPVIGLAWDGTGYGPDGAVWGAEAMLADLAGFRRLAQLRYAPLPGGDLAARTPWRVALGYRSLEPALERAFALAFRDVDERERAVASHQVARRLNAPLAGTMGRLFDAAAAVLGVRRVARYEGQAAMELEALAGSRRAEPVAMGVTRDPAGHLVLDPIPLLAALGERAQRGDDVRDLAAIFHESLVDAWAMLVERMRASTGVCTVALGGGSFQNARLLTTLGDRLRARGLGVLTARLLPPNDGAVSYGQAAVAAAILARE